jgi:hypothetical protein
MLAQESRPEVDPIIDPNPSLIPDMPLDANLYFLLFLTDNLQYLNSFHKLHFDFHIALVGQHIAYWRDNKCSDKDLLLKRK